MPVTINASPTNGLVSTADGSGVMKLQSNGVTTNALAWVNFNGTGTVAIRSAYNVSSITDNGTGDYTVNFTTALSDANYAFSFAGGGAVSSGTMVYQASTQTTSSLRYVLASTTAAQDASTQCVLIFGN